MKKLVILKKLTIAATILTGGAFSSVEVMAVPTSTPVPQSTSGYSSAVALVSTPVPKSTRGYSSTGLVSAGGISPESSIPLNCAARTIKANGLSNGSWLGSWCGAVVYFKDSSTNQETPRYVACALTSSTTADAKCSVTKTYKDLGIPTGYSAYKESVPLMPDAWPNLGTWRGYTKPPLKNVLSSAKAVSGAPAKTSRVIEIEHELVTHQ